MRICAHRCAMVAHRQKLPHAQPLFLHRWECRHLPSSLLFPPIFAAVRLPLLPVRSDWQQLQVGQELRRLLSQWPQCSVRELTEGIYPLMKEDGVSRRTVELKVGKVIQGPLTLSFTLVEELHASIFPFFQLATS